MNKTIITCLATGINIPVDILEKNDVFMKVATAAMPHKHIRMYKKSSDCTLYAGESFGFVVISTGERYV